VEEVFGIRIECNRSTNRYYIDYSEDVSDEIAESAWLIKTFTVNNILALGKQRLSGRVSVEDIPSGYLHLTSIMEAMTEGLEIEIEYQKYTAESAETLTLRPYAVKEYAKRWYLIAFCIERNGLRVYGLDRVRGLRMTSRNFKMRKGFDVDELFATSFGIYLPEGKARSITFRVPEREALFLRDLPIHKSQEEVECKDGYVTFKIFVCPDKNMLMEFCRYGSRLEVLSPADIREEVAAELSAAADMYR
jgi:predicted DNA-binding transcriptional regulator YafY